MRNKQTKKNIIYALIATLVFLLVLFFLEKSRVTDILKDPFYTDPSALDKNNAQNDPTLKRKNDVATDKDQPFDANKDSSEIPKSTNISLTIDLLEQANGRITYSATVSNPADKGTCSVVFTREGSKPVTRVDETQTEKCGPISIPELEFESVGPWLMTLRYYSNNTQAVATKMIEVR